MFAIPTQLAALAVAALLSVLPSPAEDPASAAQAGDVTPWALNATIIEACSCPMFCQCFFNSVPGIGCCPDDGDPETTDRFCLFNNAFRVNKGRHGETSLDGAKFWLAGDLGGDFSDEEFEWCILTFDEAVTPAQREGIQAILPHIYPGRWVSFEIGPDHKMEWKATRERAEARLDGGKVAEVVLVKNQGMTDDPIVIHNLRYWGAPRNDGFFLMQNEVEAWRAGERAFECKGTNGFMVTIDIRSDDSAAVPASAK